MRSVKAYKHAQHARSCKLDAVIAVVIRLLALPMLQSALPVHGTSSYRISKREKAGLGA